MATSTYPATGGFVDNTSAATSLFQKSGVMRLLLRMRKT
jgi:hypothetical protein